MVIARMSDVTMGCQVVKPVSACARTSLPGEGDACVSFWMKKAGASSVDQTWRKAKEEHRLWSYLTRKPAV